MIETPLDWAIGLETSNHARPAHNLVAVQVEIISRRTPIYFASGQVPPDNLNEMGPPAYPSTPHPSCKLMMRPSISDKGEVASNPIAELLGWGNPVMWKDSSRWTFIVCTLLTTSRLHSTAHGLSCVSGLDPLRKDSLRHGSISMAVAMLPNKASFESTADDVCGKRSDGTVHGKAYVALGPIPT